MTEAELLDKLSPRQKEIAQLLFEGCTNKEIAQRVIKQDGKPMTYGSVKVYVTRMLERLGGSSRNDIARMWARNRDNPDNTARCGRCLFGRLLCEILSALETR